ncbi:SixA phosphatase family protein [Nitratireductor basaltis]|uniref:Phosphohistidine phosphatase, SixA n=1 Tax=Nitratireductor basaltis TaxID=472175 RepID=A0A084U982_9HYPH|nr:histidine phosphatase family protein [Nitratireductor basaltis]KFB09518.1 hypothetical protein EL18_00534 [Nitratireductor basaltis]
MRELYLLRHAKSSWDDPALADHDRPLSGRGERAAPLMGRYMAEQGLFPDHVLVSPARRTRRTWKLLASELGQGYSEAEFHDDIYNASADRLLTLLRQVPDDVARVLLVGHNPGLEDLASSLADEDSDADAAARMREKYPTAALACFEVQEQWSALDHGTACLTRFVVPRALEMDAE